MSYKRLIPMVTSLIILLFPLYFFLIKIYSRDFSYILPLLLLITYFLYCFNFIRKEYIKIKADRQTGIIEKTLVLCNYNVLYAKNERFNNMPPIPTATFISYNEDEYIHLSGDFSKVDMLQGKRYKVKYYKNSGLLIDIEYNNGKSKKIKLNAKSKNSNIYRYYNCAFKPIETEYSNNSSHISFLEILIITLIGAPIFGALYILYMVFNFIQAEILMSEGDILLIQPDFVVWLFILYGFTIFMLIMFKRYDAYFGFITKLYHKLGFKNSLIIISAIFFMLLTQVFSTHTIISVNGIQCNIGYFTESKSYSWNSVKKASVYYLSEKTRNTTNKLKLHYVLELNDGKTIDLKKSEMFWSNILKVDNILENKGINIEKGTILFKDCINLLANEDIDFESGTGVLNKILNYPVRGYSSQYNDLTE